jgi:hypothetical protein
MPRISELLAKRVAQHGWWNTLHCAALRLADAVLGLRVMRGLAVEAMDPARRAAGEGFAQGFAMPRAVRRFAADAANEMSPFFVADAMARGDRCYAVCEGTVPVSTSWYSTRPTRIGLGDLVLYYAPRYVYMYKAFTQPSHRGRRLCAAAVSHAFAQYAAKGARGFISCAEATNLGSLKALQQMGYRVFGSIYVLTLFGRHFTFATPGCRAFQFHVENRPARRTRPQRLPASAFVVPAKAGTPF